MTQNNQRDPMYRLRRQMDKLRRNTSSTDSHIRAAMVEAMIRGADKAEIEEMARAVGLIVQGTDSTD